MPRATKHSAYSGNQIARRRIQFCAGHRIYGHESKCRHLHGHNYVAIFHVSAPQLDKLGRVVDFSVVKQIMGAWIEENLDHAFIAFREDLEVVNLLRTVHGQKTFVMNANPTAENIATLLLVTANARLRELGLRCDRVELEETENCSVEVWL